ncbi:transposase [Chryseobacterium phocaeense]|uniref:transposase n=1 Tax=Chryseobacterium phocaeense TaxID=1816690 RepID=UPI0009BB4393|nr:transposase [Chryseobacterium phocaeense]
MQNNFKTISIGELIRQKVIEDQIDILRICNFLNKTEEEIEKMYLCEHMDTGVLLRWSKLLKYDFFRLYSQHLILYAPPLAEKPETKKKVTALPEFRKNIYTTEVIYFILELLKTGAKTKQDIINDYKIPKTTLYKWISKYSNK